jgi:hypothetical protein
VHPILTLSLPLSEIAHFTDSTSAAAAASTAEMQAGYEDGTIHRTVHGDVLLVRCSRALHIDIGLCGFAVEMPYSHVRGSDEMPTAYPFLPHASGVYTILGAPSFLASLAGGCCTEEWLWDSGEEDCEEDQVVSWTVHECRLLAAAGPVPVGDGSLAAAAAVVVHSAAHAALLRDDPPIGLSGALLWARALQAASMAACAAERCGVETACVVADDGETAEAAQTMARLARMDALDIEAIIEKVEEDRLDRVARAQERDVLACWSDEEDAVGRGLASDEGGGL